MAADSSSNALKRSSDGECPVQRKVRKGTQSCWECKRRKVRCTFASPEDTTCEPCTQRKTLCVSQELPDPGRTSQIDDRISRVEGLLEQVLRQLPDRHAVDDGPGQNRDAENHFEESAHGQLDDHHGLRISTTESASKRDHQHAKAPSSSGVDNNDLFDSLLAALPSEGDLKILARESFETPSCLQGLPSITTLNSSAEHASLRTLTQIPSSGSHPAPLAKHLLILACYLQAMPQSTVERLARSEIDVEGIASHAVHIVRRKVLSNEEQARSIDGIECLAIESMYYNNAGRLRDAWIPLRSAISIAQLLGVDRRAFRASVPSILASREQTKEEAIWLHLLSSDRYLSLMLGLPQGAPDSNNFALPEAMAPCSPLQRLQRYHCLVGGCMLRHRDRRNVNTGFTQEMDVLLQEAASNMEPQWWLVPDLSKRDQDVPLEDTLRLMTQFTHLHIIARLHLPYLLHSPAEGGFDHHKLTTINTSREILVRYAALRGSDSTNNYCGGVDFLMFIAATTLCIAHINSSYWRRQAEQGSHSDYLGHQRPGDRGLMECALQAMERSGRQGTDEIDTKISCVLQHLLKSEDQASKGASISVSTFTNDDVSEHDSGLASDGKTLRIVIPYVGLIKIERDGVSVSRGRPGSSVSDMGAFAEVMDESPITGDPAFPTLVESSNDGSQPNGLLSPNWCLQGVDTALFNDLVRDWELDNVGI